MSDPGDHPVPVRTEPVPVADAGPGDATITWRLPSPLLLRVRRIEVALVTVPVAIAGGVAGAFVSTGLAIGIAVAVVAAGVVAERFLARRVAGWGYAERQDDLMVRRGVLVRQRASNTRPGRALDSVAFLGTDHAKPRYT